MLRAVPGSRYHLKALVTIIIMKKICYNLSEYVRELKFRTTPDTYPCQQEATGEQTKLLQLPPSVLVYIPSPFRGKRASLPLLLLPPAGWGGKEELAQAKHNLSFFLLPFSHFSLPGLQISLNIKAEQP